MSLQSSAGVPPPPLIPGGLNVHSAQVSRSTKLSGVFVVPVTTTAALNVPIYGIVLAESRLDGEKVSKSTILVFSKEMTFFDGTVWKVITSS